MARTDSFFATTRTPDKTVSQFERGIKIREKRAEEEGVSGHIQHWDIHTAYSMGSQYSSAPTVSVEAIKKNLVVMSYNIRMI